jgi:ribosomal protein S18 acetylase RimI-like enzyme
VSAAPGVAGAFLRIEAVDHAALPTARQLHAVQMRAYAQEAVLLGATFFPPLERTVEDVMTCTEAFVAAFAGDAIVGAISMEPDGEGLGMNIASLVVEPRFQRQGIGRRLLDAALATHGMGEMTVQTGARNLPALALYEQVGFVAFRHWLVGSEPLALVKLRRPGDAACGQPLSRA